MCPPQSVGSAGIANGNDASPLLLAAVTAIRVAGARRLQPGAPATVRSNGSGMPSQLLLLKPVSRSASAPGAALVRLTLKLAPSRGRPVALSTGVAPLPQQLTE